MTTKKLASAKAAAVAQVSAKYEAAEKIRALLDEARKGSEDPDELEREILELVSEE